MFRNFMVQASSGTVPERSFFCLSEHSLGTFPEIKYWNISQNNP